MAVKQIPTRVSECPDECLPTVRGKNLLYGRFFATFVHDEKQFVWRFISNSLGGEVWVCLANRPALLMALVSRIFPHGVWKVFATFHVACEKMSRGNVGG